MSQRRPNDMAGETAGAEILITDVTHSPNRTLLRCRTTCWPNLKVGDRFSLWSIEIEKKKYARVETEVLAVYYQYSNKDLENLMTMVIEVKTVGMQEESEIGSCQMTAYLR